ncbi:MAG TPA: hypothetical protein VNQ77_04850 [Frankiaceae bacterium]|nr:hypothetical protein [Frankiaceae bacterium]
MQFAPKHVVAMVSSVCAAVVLAPVGVMAATGTLVNLTDPLDGSRKARVSGISGLYVDTRPRATAGSFHAFFENVVDVTTLRPAKETSAPNGIAVTSFVVTVKGDANTSINHVRIFSRERTSGSASCANGSGWSTSKTLATVAVRAGSTEQVLFNGPPLVVGPAASGRRICVGVQQTQHFGSTATDVAVTGFTFS